MQMTSRASERLRNASARFVKNNNSMAASSPELLKILPENQESEAKENEEEIQQYLLEKEDDV